MSDILWLMAANIAVWLGLGAYMIFLVKEQKSIDKRLSMQEVLGHE